MYISLRNILSRKISNNFPVLIFLFSLAVIQVHGQQEIEHSNNDIILPTVVLELDEPAVSNLEFSLPIDLQIVTPERWPPLPPAGEFDVDLQAAVGAPLMEFVKADNSGLGHSLVAETYVSAGTTFGYRGEKKPIGFPLSQLSSGLSVLGTGPDGDFSLAFTHNFRDGIRGILDPGEGAKTERHELTGSVGLGLGMGELEAEATIVSSEHGFQGHGESGGVGPNSAESQIVAGGARYRFPLDERLEILPALEVRADATTLTGISSTTHSELSAEPSLIVNWDSGIIELQFNFHYLFRRYLQTGVAEPQNRHNANLGVSGRIDLGLQTGLELSLAWSLRNDAIQDKFSGHRLEPQVVVSGTPIPWFSYVAGAGYEVRELGVASVTEHFPYIQPRSVRDDDGWFIFGRAQFSLGQLAGLSELTLVATTRLSTHSAILVPGTRSEDNNLYELNQENVKWSVIPGIGLGLGFGETLQIRANVSGEIAREHVRTNLTPLLQSELELEVRTSDGQTGIRINAATSHVPALGDVQLPEVDVEGLWQRDATTVTITLSDVLELLGEPRKDWPPYLRPGFGAAVTVNLTL